MNENAFAEDTPHSLYNELKTLEDEILSAANDVVTKGRNAQVASNDYDVKKHSEIVTMASEESSPDFKEKRTDMIRQAKYRQKYATERTNKGYAERDFELAKSYLQALQSLSISKQARAKLLLKEF